MAYRATIELLLDVETEGRTIYKMITRERAEAVARELFLDDYLSRRLSGCTCRYCTLDRQRWRSIVGKTRLAMKRAFS
jgi:hypothetical protein